MNTSTDHAPNLVNGDVADTVAAMLTENTGRHFLDSGGAYGRNWERNQGMTRELWEQSPTVTLHVWRDDDWYVTLNLYHFLTACLDAPDPELESLWVAHRDDPELADEGWLTVMQSFCERLRDEHGMNVGGIYGDGDPFTFNSYNDENLLSQDIQGTYFECGDLGAFVLLQIHGGCDIRGGYTEPRLFAVNGELSIFDWNRADAGCSQCNCCWELGSYSSYEWHYEGSDWNGKVQGCFWTPDPDAQGTLIDNVEYVTQEIVHGMVGDGDEKVVRCGHCGAQVQFDSYVCY